MYFQSGRSTLEKESDISQRTADPSCISPNGTAALGSGSIVQHLRKLKAQRLRWTTAWRRLHKKIKQSDQGKLKKKKVFKAERAIEGVTLEAIKKIRTARPEDKKALA